MLLLSVSGCPSAKLSARVGRNRGVSENIAHGKKLPDRLRPPHARTRSRAACPNRMTGTFGVNLRQTNGRDRPARAVFFRKRVITAGQVNGPMAYRVACPIVDVWARGNVGARKADPLTVLSMKGVGQSRRVAILRNECEGSASVVPANRAKGSATSVDAAGTGSGRRTRTRAGV